MVDKNSVIEVLKKHPKGLKAKDIAAYIYGADRKAINQILYTNPNLFSCNTNYEWTLLSSKITMIKNPTTIKKIKPNKTYTDKEIFNNYKNFYVEVKQGYLLSENTTLKLYLMGDNDYIIQSSSKKLQCPFCNNIISARSFDCDKCGHTMHEICENLYAKGNNDGHRFYITWRPLNEYPADERNRKLYEAVRGFIKSSLPYTICNYFKDVIDEVHLSTLLIIYQKGLGIEKVEEEIKNEIVAEKQNLTQLLKDNPQTDAELKTKAQYYLDKACVNDKVVDYEACKYYLAYISLLNRTASLKYIKSMVTLKIYGNMDLSNNTIYQTVRLSYQDTIESSEYLRTYHKDCDHYCEKAYLKIPLLLASGEIITRTILGTYCNNCKKYFVLDTEFKKILCEGRIQTQISFSESGSHFNGMDLSPESLLMKCGYTVSATSKVTKEQRQKLLKSIIENKLYTPAKIVTHFRFLVSMNNNVISRDMSVAISKWEEDIAFLQQNYR